MLRRRIGLVIAVAAATVMTLNSISVMGRSVGFAIAGIVWVWLFVGPVIYFHVRAERRATEGRGREE